MPFLDDQAKLLLRKDPAGLEIAHYWRRTVGTLGDPARRLLSYLVSSLMSRGWLASVDKLLDTAADNLHEKRDQVAAEFETLLALDLVSVEAGKVTQLAGLLSTKPTGLIFKYDQQHEVHLLGPLAALAVSHALQKAGEVRAVCQDDPAQRIVLTCDTAGIATRAPETVTLFLPAWDGDLPPAQVARGGGLFRSDEALDLWQQRNGNPAGMPIASMLFPMAAVDLGADLGSTLEAALNHLPDFS